MSTVDQFIQILKAGDIKEIVPFLQSCSSVEKETLSVTIKKIYRDLKKYYNGTSEIPLKEITQLILLSQKAEEILEITSFVCLKSYEEVRRLEVIISLEILEEYILPWYRPAWLNRYLLEVADFYFDYDSMLRFTSKGWLKPTKEFIAENAAYGLLKNKDGLQENIWYLFEYYTNIGYGDHWIERFKELIQSGDIERIQVLKEALLTSNRGFNKPFTSWFCKLFASLEPSKKELLSLQNELFLSLSSPHSKPVGDALKYLKQIAKEPDFKIETFIEYIPLLLAWNVKSIVTSTLSMLDLLMKTYQKQKETLGLLIVQVLGQEDESLQIKAIKLLSKHKLLENKNIVDEIEVYDDMLYHSAKELLPAVIENTETTKETIKITPAHHIREDNRIIYPESYEEMVFFFSQVSEGNNLYDFELFVTLLPRLYSKITEENLFKLEPVFQKAFHYFTNPPTYQYSEIKKLMAHAFVCFGYFYLKSFREGLYKELERTYLNKIVEDTYRDARAEGLKKEIENFKHMDCRASIINVHHRLIVSAFERIEKGDYTEAIFLSTHNPCWIDTKILEERLKHQHDIHPYELQVALSKTCFSKATQISSVNTEINDLLAYMQTKEMSLPIEKIQTPEYWIAPLLRKNDPQDLALFAKHFQAEKHDIAFSHILNGTITNKNSKNPIFHSHCVQLVRTLSFKTIYHFTRILPFTNDASFMLSLVPTLPNFILETQYKTPEVIFEPIMPTVIEIWGDYGSSNYLFIARTFIDMSKTTRQFSAELWHKATLEGTMNQQRLGEILGKLEHNEYAPLKRFTDLVVSNMLNLSTLHNQGLHTLLSSMIAHMNNEPIKGTKKLLEIYLEVLHTTKLTMPDDTREKIVHWDETKSLKTIIKKILKDQYEPDIMDINYGAGK